MTQPLLSFAAPIAALAVFALAAWLVPAPPTATADELAEVAVGYIKNGHRAFALDTLREAQARDATSFRVNFVLGTYAMQERRYREAYDHLQVALAQRPNDVDANLNMGSVCHGLGDFVQAGKYFDKVLVLQPNHPKALFNLATIGMQIFNYPMAKHYLEAYLRVATDPFDADLARERLGQVNQRLKERPST
jgi:Tfp pilus assembly protein PilF